MQRFAETVLRHCRIVSLVGLVLFVSGGYAASQLPLVPARADPPPR